MDAGHGFQILGNQLGGCVDVGCSNISIVTGYTGDLIIDHNQIYSAGVGFNSTGVFLGAGQVSMISNNTISRATTAISVAGGVNSFNVVNNFVGGSPVYGTNTTGISIGAGAGDFYSVIGNNCSGVSGVGIFNGATGTNKTILNGACP